VIYSRTAAANNASDELQRTMAIKFFKFTWSPLAMLPITGLL